MVIRHSTIDLPGLPRSLREDHARFLRDWRDALVTCGPIFRGEAPSGYLYQLDLPGTVPRRPRALSPTTRSRCTASSRATRSAIGIARSPTRHPTAPPRPGLNGFFFHGIGKPGITEFRNTIVAAHRAHLQQRDASNCLSRGYLTDSGGREWLGSAMV